MSNGLSGVAVACLAVAGFALWYLPGDTAARNIARSVSDRGTWATASDVEVHVDHEYAKGGGWDEVDQVRARLPGWGTRITLDAVAADETLSEDIDWKQGWQPATRDTGYQGPLQVRVQTGPAGEPLHVVAETDLNYWTVNNNDPEVELAIGTAGVALAITAVLVNGILVRRHRLTSTSGALSSSRPDRRGRRHRDSQGVWSAGKAGRATRRRRR